MNQTKLFENKYNFIPLAALVFSFAGVVVTAFNILVVGIILSAIGLAVGIATKILEKKVNLNERLAYWGFTLSIILFVVSALAFAGYSVYNYVWDKNLDK